MQNMLNTRHQVRRSIFAVLLFALLLFLPRLAYPQAKPTGLSADLYEDPRGFFRIRPPAGWELKTFSDDPRGKVKFIGPQGANILALGGATELTTLDALLADSKASAARSAAKYAALGANASTEATQFRDFPAVKGTMVFPGKLKQFSIEFLLAGRYYSVSFAAPQQIYEELLPLAEKCIHSIDPIPGGSTSAEARKHVVASKIRLAELNIQMGYIVTARRAVDEGLDIDPGNEKLLALKKQIALKP